MNKNISTLGGLLLAISLTLVGCNGADDNNAAPVEVPATPSATPVVNESGPTATTTTNTTTVTSSETLTNAEMISPTIPVTEGAANATSEALTATNNLTTTGAVSASSAVTPPATTMVGVREADGRVVRASDLLGYNVQNMDAQDLGTIDNLVIDLASGRILFANLSYGGFLDIGDKTFPIPLNAFASGPDGQTLYLNVPEETLQNAPGFDDSWPDPTVADWNVETEHFWRNLEIQLTPLADSGDTAVIARYSDLQGSTVLNPAGEDLGKIDDLIVDLGQGVVDYAVMSFGGFLGINEKEFAIPLSAFQRTVVRDLGYDVNLVLDVTEDQLQAAPSLEGEWPDSTNPNWDGPIRDFWGVIAEAATPSAPTAAGAGAAMELTAPFDPTAAPLRVSQLLGAPVYNVDGATLGHIQEMVLGANDSAGHYVVLATDGADSNGNLIPVPIGVLMRRVDDQSLVINTSAEDLNNAPHFAGDAWPTTIDASFEQNVYDYWSSAGYPTTNIYPLQTAPPSVRIGGLPPLALTTQDFLNRPVVNRDEEQIGTVEDLIYTQGFVRYALLALNEQDGLKAVPLYALFYDGANQRFMLDTPPDQLAAAPNFDEAAWSDNVAPDWDAASADYWMNTVGVPARLGVRSLATTNMLASMILGANVYGANEETLGNIEDLVINTGDGNIRYAIVSFGGFLGLGENYFAIPLDQLNLDPYLNSFSTALTEEKLTGAPSFTNDNWPDFGQPSWDADFRQFWQSEGVTVTTNVSTTQAVTTNTEVSTTPALVRASELMDYNVVAANGDDIGSVDDMLINFFDSRASHLVLGIGGFLNIGEREVAVPLDVPQIDLANGQILLDVDEAAVDAAPEFDASLWSQAANDQWLDDADQYWENR